MITKGFSLIEMIASTVMGTIILGFALGGFISMRQSFVLDKGGGDVNQRLRTIFATIGPDLQQLGQGLTNTSIPLPLVKLEVFNAGTANETSAITTRKVIIPKVLTPESQLDKNTVSTTIVVKEDSDTLTEWKNTRINNGGKIRASILNSLGQEQFFDYIGENIDTSVSPPISTITIASTTWANDYPPNSSIYLMDKRKYEVKDNTLTLTVNDNNTFKLVEYVEKLNIVATIESRNNSGTTFFSECKGIPDTGTPTNCNTAPIGYKFENIRAIDVKATVKQKGNDHQKKQLNEENLTMSQKFFPRNTIN
ncbi:PilW family protein [Geminocystis herdmanii]|uniref:PilW family protein n=1 Tax=Geminocystis herdmanii TaxID=669359 RepID=UPI00036FEFC9|nr:hypothetical protein [Geminocystis herdmanii]